MSIETYEYVLIIPKFFCSTYYYVSLIFATKIKKKNMFKFKNFFESQ